MADVSPHATTKNAHPDLARLAGGLAIVTGGASGIGFALAEAAIDHGLHPVIADIDSEAIASAEKKLISRAQAGGVEVLACQVDVSSEKAVRQMADAVAQRFPDKPVSLLCCNAGVGGGGSVLKAKDIDWDFVLGVNVKGVANCVRLFVPGMMSQDGPGSVVMTASQDGLCAAQGVYGVSKHACVALTEALYQEVRGRLSVHVLCPNVVGTNIVKSEQHRPEQYGGTAETRKPDPRQEQLAERFKAFGIPPSTCAGLVFDAIRSGDIYIMAEAKDDPGHIRHQAQVRMDAILNGGKLYRPGSAFLGKVFSSKAPAPGD